MSKVYEYSVYRVNIITFEQLCRSAHTADAARAVCFVSTDSRAVDSSLRKFSAKEDILRPAGKSYFILSLDAHSNTQHIT